MKISEEIKKLQDEMIKKYNYIIGNNHSGSTAFIKKNAGEDSWCLGISREVYELVIFMSHLYEGPEQITIYTTQYTEYANPEDEDKKLEKKSRHFVKISLEELDLLCAIAHQIAKENGWDSIENGLYS